MRVLICGGRDFTNESLLLEVLFPYWNDTTDLFHLEIISGCAKGADTLAIKYAEMLKLKCHKFPADWDKYGPSAGPIRNQQMIDEGKPDLVIAFPTKNSRGTYDMIRRAEKHGIKTIIVKEEVSIDESIS